MRIKIHFIISVMLFAVAVVNLLALRWTSLSIAIVIAVFINITVQLVGNQRARQRREVARAKFLQGYDKGYDE